jgi:hypothetical protein
MKILVCGGREYLNKSEAFSFLDNITNTTECTLVIHGGARGADTLGGDWAKLNNIPTQVFKPDWNGLGMAAGHIRNQEMLDEGKPDLVVAFPGGSGTKSMMQKTLKAGVKLTVFQEEEDE